MHCKTRSYTRKCSVFGAKLTKTETIHGRVITNVWIAVSLKLIFYIYGILS